MMQTRSMKILVVWASRHGSTEEVANAIVDELRAEGIDADIKQASEVTDISSYDGFVMGSSVYMTQWEDCRRFIRTRRSVREGTVGVLGGAIRSSNRHA